MLARQKKARSPTPSPQSTTNEGKMAVVQEEEEGPWLSCEPDTDAALTQSEEDDGGSAT